ncbi:ABC transporter ATP-binding protein [Pseudobacteriovorax antillogorgiicola]|uniref:ABC-2 type transport system ATP-binding protein n=1 Tax=Pseudobacteriovorax antillogorgiicola TaxID=1513793 RepID=A0A1Y6CIG0_9BACT|nr:ABC transporter ATP-binding protein [Pseudobacteriovorax antillogorgiicola]TCS48313.1 ABC-2 type transport system ATP-binding protein [Pseudobacteriovorax antillogorgiicola]SMF56654.1 ABC-2 type transport system ATP-binding protein [Pseudobacteriovorax antillogorgiicola]
MAIVLQVDQLVKSFGSVKAVRGTSFEVLEGQCFGLLGPNGAGKSTTIEMIEGITNPDEGQILFCGEPFKGPLRDKMGVQFQNTALPPKLTVREALQTFRNLYSRGLEIEALINLCQLKEFVNQQHEKISGGQKQRLLLAIALCHDPELILLDEPTTGLDPQARRHVWNIVREIKAKGKTLILTTHYMDEAEQLCDDIAIMDHGQIMARGSPRKLLHEHCKNTIVFLPESDVANHIWLNRAKFGQVYQVHLGVEIHTQDLNDILSHLGTLNMDLTGINIRQSNLDDLFLQLTGKELRQ